MKGIVLYILKTKQKISMDCPTYVPQSKKAAAAEVRKSNDIRLQHILDVIPCPIQMSTSPVKKINNIRVLQIRNLKQNTSGIILEKNKPTRLLSQCFMALKQD